MVKNPSFNARDPALIPGLGRSPGEGNGNPPPYSCLENPTDRRINLTFIIGIVIGQPHKDCED